MKKEDIAKTVALIHDVARPYLRSARYKVFSQRYVVLPLSKRALSCAESRLRKYDVGSRQKLDTFVAEVLDRSACPSPILKNGEQLILEIRVAAALRFLFLAEPYGTIYKAAEIPLKRLSPQAFARWLLIDYWMRSSARETRHFLVDRVMGDKAFWSRESGKWEYVYLCPLGKRRRGFSR